MQESSAPRNLQFQCRLTKDHSRGSSFITVLICAILDLPTVQISLDQIQPHCYISEELEHTIWIRLFCFVFLFYFFMPTSC